MSTPNFPTKLTIDWLTGQYAEGALTPEQVIEEIIRRAEADAAMNIWIAPPQLEQIRPYLSRLLTLDPAVAPLWGIPFAVKDNIDVAGLPTTSGCPDYAYSPSEHATAVRRLIEAGAIPVGKTNLDQFATGLVGTRSPYGETHNALRPELISGGSSSGSAVAVARGQATFALGTDTAGSGRVPAALNNLVGWKASLGAWPVKGVVPACESLDCVTVFASEMAEVQAVDQAVRGVDLSDPWSRDIPYRNESRLPSKIYLPQEPLEFYGPFADGYRLAWEKAQGYAKQLGIPVTYIETELFAAAASLLYEGPWVAERWAEFGEFVESHPGSAFPVTEQILRSGAAPVHHAAAVFQAMHKLQGYKLQARQLLQDGVLIMPTAGGTWTRDQVREEPIAANRAMGLYTNHCNLLDLCAVAIPSGEVDTNVPFGITLFALAGSEGLIVEAAERYKAVQSRPTTLVAVCGLHMRGFPLEAQMKSHEATFIREDASAPSYKLIKLPTEPAKPGMIKCASGGASIAVEVWEMPLERFGSFASLIPAPLGMGKVELIDGSVVPGFICEGYAAESAEDITSFGGWRASVAAAGAVR
ncbi:allophanate hydrolase [Paenibacillus phyllosphaerae]|uniref:Allophanate hydrolase n=1 Tax=Paenibacillus phyllosphaerae TaxID=274593 RepID=A0A7W5AXX3_9BACL|nr:allophanate hydrolase [Paenibacillus phyllosphaerae]MBB3110181.1 allophanate hydrolase [Paenibacillus phyllosphaerae]